MANLPRIPDSDVLIQAPRSNLTAADIANPYLQISQALGETADALQKKEVADASYAGSNAVYRDQDGNLQVDLRSNLTASGRAYNRAAIVGYTARAAGEIRNSGQELSDQSQGDPTRFAQSWKAFTNTFLGKVPPELRGSVSTMLDSEGSKYALGVSEVKRKRDIADAQTDITTEIASLDDQMSALARQPGGTATKTYQDYQQQVKSLYGELVGNPDFGVTKVEADTSLQRMESRHLAMGLVGQVDQALKTGGIADAQKLADGVLTDTSLQLKPSERQQFHNLMNQEIRNWGVQRKADLKPVQDQAKTIIGRLNQGIGIDGDDVDQTASALAKGGDMAGAMDLITARAKARFMGAFKAAPDSQQAEMYRSYTAGKPVTLPSDAQGAISAAAAKYGVDPAYLSRVAQIESHGKTDAVSSTGAKGPFQFVPGTAKRYGLADPTDWGQSADAAARLTVDNRNYLRNALGRDPTPGELYLAHQQGAAGAAALLENPTRAAIDVVGEDAVLKNGGNAKMTAGQFAELWIRKFDKGPSLDYSGIDPKVVADMRTEITTDAKNLWDRMKTGMAQSLPPDSDSVQLLAKQLPLINDDNFRKQVSDFFQSNQAAAVINALAPADRDALLSSLKGDAAKNGASLMQQQIIESAVAQKKAQDQALSVDPLGYGIERGVVPAMPALNLGAAPDDLTAQFAARQKGVDSLAARGWGGSTTSALRPADQTAVMNFIRQATPAETAQLFGSMSQGLSEPTYQATLAGLAKNGDTSDAAVAGALYRDNPAVAEAILRGQALLKQNPNLAPKKTDANRASIDELLPPPAFGPTMEGARQNFVKAATGRYADLSQQAGDTSGIYDPDRFRQAVTEVTGGILDFNGSPVIAPSYGMSQDQFDALLKADAGKMSGAITNRGQPITMKDVQREGRLRAIGDGQYLVEFGTPQAPTYAMSAPDPLLPGPAPVGGGPFVLDLRTH